MTTGPQSNLSAPAGYSSSDLVFNDNFSGTTLDSNWHPYLASNGSSGGPWNSIGSDDSTEGGLYMDQYDVPSQVSVDNGLTLTTTQQSIVGKNGSASQTYPYTSGAVSSYGSFEFTGGYLQISMQQPSGDGSWPALWLVPGQGAGNAGIVGDNFEIDMQEGNYTSGSSNPNDNVAWHLHTSAGVFGGVTTVGTNLSSGFNTYAIDWEPGKSITWYLNGQQVGQITSAQAPIPDEPMEVIMDNAVANSAASSFRTVADSSTPSTMPMQVGDVQLYQKPGSGDTVLGANVTANSGGTGTGTVTSTGSTPSSNTSTSGGSSTSGAGTASASGSAGVTDPVTSTSADHGRGHVGTTSTVTATDHPLGSRGSASPQSLASSPQGGLPARSGSTHQFDVSQFDQYPGFARAVNTLSDAISSRSRATSSIGPAADPTASTGHRAYALLSQTMAGDFGNTSHFVQNGSPTAPPRREASDLLTRPLH
jgi:beta-glucanase (GH16 family)